MAERRIVLNSDGFPEVEGMRYNGYRWVAANSTDTERAVMTPPPSPGLDIFGGTGVRKPPRHKPKTRKSRRRFEEGVCALRGR